MSVLIARKLLRGQIRQRVITKDIWVTLTYATDLSQVA